MQLSRDVTVTYYRNKHYEWLTGQIMNWNALTGCLQLADGSGGEHRFYLRDIMDITWRIRKASKTCKRNKTGRDFSQAGDLTYLKKENSAKNSSTAASYNSLF